ncbi:alpha/beta hydrolase [Noviherbaspirillum sp.]|uniref:alpha/beta hydrolase n=1 Tax=Noviherbaspirillum sp. TaxID=1926288 RepID=UPI002FE10E53
MPNQPFFSSTVQWLRRRGIRLAVIAGLGVALAGPGCSHLAQKERELTFRIAAGTASWYGGLPDGITESVLPIDNKGKTENIHTWWWPAATPDAPAVLYLHGSRWNLTGQAFRIEQLHDFGFSVLAIDYRGFGKSDGGLPSEETVYEDARVAWKQLASLQPDPARRFIYGHSLGGAIAVDLAAELSRADQPQARGLIVESSFTSLADIARALTSKWLPLQLLMSQKFDSIDKIADVRMPTLFVHGTRDRFVPARFSQELFDAASGEKRLLLVEGGTHNNSMRVGAEAYRQALTEVFGWTPAPS